MTPLVNETNSDVAEKPDPTAESNNVKSRCRTGSAAVSANEPEKCEVTTALAIPTADTSADVVSKPGLPMAPAVVISVAPSELAEANTGVEEGGLDCESNPTGPFVIATVVTSYVALSNVTGQAVEEAQRLIRSLWWFLPWIPRPKLDRD